MEEQQIATITEEQYNTVVHTPDPYFIESFENSGGSVNMNFSTTELTYVKDDFINAIKKYMYDSGVYFVSKKMAQEESGWQEGDPDVLYYDTRNFATVVLVATFDRKSYNFPDLHSDAQYAEMLIHVPTLLKNLYLQGYVRKYVGAPQPGKVSYRVKGVEFSELQRMDVLSGKKAPNAKLNVADYNLALFVPASPLVAVNVTFNIGSLDARRVFNLKEKKSSTTRTSTRAKKPVSEATKLRNARISTSGVELPTTRNVPRPRTSGRQSSPRAQSPRSNGNGQPQQRQVVAPTTTGRRRRTNVPAPVVQSPQENLEIDVLSNGSIHVSPTRSPRSNGNASPRSNGNGNGRVSPRRNGSPNGNVSPRRNGSPRSNGNGNGRVSPRRNGSPRSNGNGNGNGNGRVSPRRNNGSPRRSPNGNGNGLLEIDLDAPVGELFEL